MGIVGSKVQSQARKLDNKYKNNFERGSTDTFELKLADLGTLKSLTLRKSGHDDWMVDSVSVKASDTNAVFLSTVKRLPSLAIPSLYKIQPCPSLNLSPLSSKIKL